MEPPYNSLLFMIKKRRISRNEFPSPTLPRVVYRFSTLLINHYPESGGTKSKVAVVVSKKFSKKAVVRNRVKRVIYGLVRTHSDIFDNFCKGKVVFSIRSNYTKDHENSMKEDFSAFIAQIIT